MKIFTNTENYLPSTINSKYYDKTNDLVVGKMKGKTCCLPIKSFAGLKAKMCNNKCKKKKVLVKRLLMMN